MNIYEKLLAIQAELKAPKSQYNDFGKYNYRNCEDILEAVKPVCLKYNAVCFLSDKIVFVEGRHYIEATATLVDCEKTEDRIAVTANAREEESKKGMDGSQVTGASSSYARKYALNGLFDIDDTKDSDTTNKGDKGGFNGRKDKLSVNAEKADLGQNAPSKHGIILQMLKGQDKLTIDDASKWVRMKFKKNFINDCDDEQFELLKESISEALKKNG